LTYKIRINGFTLLEILISLLILSIIGVVITSGLNLTVETQTRLGHKYKALAEVQLALSILELDLQQITDRPILDENGEIRPALIISENNLEFTRSGFINPFSMNKRSTLQRVAYNLVGTELIRTTWPTLDRAEDSIADKQVILTQVKEFYIHLINSANKGIIIEINLSELGSVKRVIAIPTTALEVTYAPTS